MICYTMGYGSSVTTSEMCLTDDQNAERNFKKVDVACTDDMIADYQNGDTISPCDVKRVRDCSDKCDAVTIVCNKSTENKCLPINSQKLCNRVRRRGKDTCVWENDSCIRAADTATDCASQEKKDCKRTYKEVCSWHAGASPDPTCMKKTDYNALGVCAKNSRREMGCKEHATCQWTGTTCQVKPLAPCGDAVNENMCYRVSLHNRKCNWRDVEGTMTCVDGPKEKDVVCDTYDNVESCKRNDCFWRNDACVSGLGGAAELVEEGKWCGEPGKPNAWPNQCGEYDCLRNEQNQRPLTADECAQLVAEHHPNAVYFMWNKLRSSINDMCQVSKNNNDQCDTINSHVSFNIYKLQGGGTAPPRTPDCDKATTAPHCDREALKGDGANCVWTGTECKLDGEPMVVDGDCTKGVNKAACHRERAKGKVCVWQGEDEDEPCKENGTPIVEVCAEDGQNQQHCERIGKNIVQCKWRNGACVENGTKSCSWATNTSGCKRMADALSPINCKWDSESDTCKVDGVSEYDCTNGENLQHCKRKGCWWNAVDEQCFAEGDKVWDDEQCRALATLQQCKRQKKNGCEYDYKDAFCFKPEEQD